MDEGEEEILHVNQSKDCEEDITYYGMIIEESRKELLKMFEEYCECNSEHETFKDAIAEVREYRENLERVYEDGTPHQIFESPLKPKTKEFIYKIRTFNHIIEDRKFDLYALNSEIEGFLKNQLFDEKRINKVLLVCEEMIYNYVFKSFGDSFAPVEFTLRYSEKKDETELIYKSELINKSVLSAAEDISRSIVDKSANSVVCEDNTLKVTI